MAGMLQMRRSRGAFSGFVLMLLGLWGALIPFIGPYFHYSYTPDTAWVYTSARLYLEIMPGAAVFLGGFFLMIATGRHTAIFGALLAAASGAWFTLGTMLSPLWNNHVTLGGVPAADTVFRRIMEQLGFFSALGVVILFFSCAALGRVLSVPAGIRVVEPVTDTVPEETAPTQTFPAADDAATESRASGLPFRRVSSRNAPVTTVPAETVPASEDTQTIG